MNSFRVNALKHAALIAIGATLLISGCRFDHASGGQQTNIVEKRHIFGCTASARGECHFILYTLENPPHKIPKRVLKRFTLRVGQRLDVSRIVGMPDKVKVCLAARPDSSLDRCLIDGASENPTWSESAINLQFKSVF